ncbi:MAG: sigma-70 family RNA polymerase sigma factor [Anaerolineales bacterium]|nr:sigma-70 family RNA polymerase sigma factor [Anaerolineales bacterium]MCA9978010.1 sigma-70 family RNA polymerase sigma factor [Anaerolineales bacterium]
MTQVDALIERWRQGDERAAELLYNTHQGRAYRLAYGLLGHAADAEEAAQDALTYALVNIHRYDARRASFSTWLHTITVSRCRDKRRRKLLPCLSLTAWLQKGMDVADPNPDPEGETAVSEIRSQVWQAVQSLPPPYREAIVLRYWAGHTYREMSVILKCPVPTAQSRVRLAFKQLRAVLEPADLAVLEQQL